MKTLRMLGLALMAILMGGNLASCSKEGNPDGSGDFSNEKKLVKMVCESDEYSCTQTFRYDSKGRLTEATKTDNNRSNTYNLIWGDDRVLLHNVRQNDGIIFTLSNGLIQNYSNYDSSFGFHTFTYNQSNRFIKWGYVSEQPGENITKLAIWDGDKLARISNYEGGQYSYTYNGTCTKGYFPFYLGSLIEDVWGDMLFSAHPELIGARSSQLPATEKSDGKTTYTYRYEFDKDGYISKIYEEGADTYIYSLTWAYPDATVEQVNPIAGTVWEWSQDFTTWTFSFSDTEVILDYKAEFSPNDITTKQYKSTYSYAANTVTFEMNGWSSIVWKFTGTISGNTLHLVDNSIEKLDMLLTKVEFPDLGTLVPGYENGVATLATAGTLKSLLGDDYLNITSLKVVGEINGDDIYYLRRMLGDSSYSIDERGKLTSLDLSQTIIKEGGEYYYMNTLGQTYRTRNNVVGEYMFCLCTNLADIILPNTALSIEPRAFYSSLFNSVAIGDGVISIKKEAFKDCDYLNSISIGKGLTNIESDAFGSTAIDIYIKDLSSWCNIDRECLYCQDLYLNGEKVEDLTIPEDITEIKTGTFVCCSSLKSVNIGDNVTKIGTFAFGACRSLTTVTIGDNVKEIGQRAFHECESLKSITIGKGCSVIKSQAFFDCSPDGTVYCYASTPPSINESTFNKNMGKTLYVPDRYSAAYKSSDWADFFDQIKGIN